MFYFSIERPHRLYLTSRNGTTPANFDSCLDCFLRYFERNDVRKSNPMGRPEYMAVVCLCLARIHRRRMDKTAVALDTATTGEQLADHVRANRIRLGRSQ